MNTSADTDLTSTLLSARDRCARQGFLTSEHASISLRLPGTPEFLFADAQTTTPHRQSWQSPPVDGTTPLHPSAPTASALHSANDPRSANDPHTPSSHPALTLHATIYQLRPDVGAILTGGGQFSTALHNLGGRMPVAFDEQARHLGRMASGTRQPLAASQGHPTPDITAHELQAALANGTNTALLGDLSLSLGTTCQRLTLNAELFEKCAKAYVLAAATGQPVTTLPWWVCTIAIGRLRKDQRRATQSFAQGLLPQEARGY